jgi:hypothetical protein
MYKKWIVVLDVFKKNSSPYYGWTGHSIIELLVSLCRLILEVLHSTGARLLYPMYFHQI